jgi:transposase
MISDDKKALIVRLFLVEKWKIGTIARQVGVHHETVQTALHEQQVLPRAAPSRSRLVDPYMPLLLQTLDKYPTLCASRLYQMVKERGYRGRPDHFRAVVRRIRPRPVAEAYQRLHTLPGEQGQVDWGHFGTLRVGRALRRLSAFVMVLSYSRQMFVRFYLGQQLSLFLDAHQEAFEFLGGVPRVLLYDNLKSVVLERQGDAIRFQPALWDFAGHLGYEPRPVAPYRGNEKGRVERAIRYIRDAFFAARPVADLATLNAEALRFCLTEVGDRRHPQDRTLTVRQAWELEKPRLVPLPAVPYPVEECVPVQIGKTPYARFDKNDYSVPHDKVKRTLMVHASVHQVRILEGTQLLAEHPRSWDQGQQVEDPAHLQALKERKVQARAHRGCQYLTNQVPGAQVLLAELAQRGENLGSASAALLRLLDHYGPAAMQQAVKEAQQQGSPSPQSVRLILERLFAARNQPAPVAVGLPTDSPLRKVHVVPHSLSTYDQLTQENRDDDIDEDDLF